MQRFFRNIWSMQRFVSRQPLLPNPLVAECCEKANAGTHLLSLSNHCFGSDFLFFSKNEGERTLWYAPLQSVEKVIIVFLGDAFYRRASPSCRKAVIHPLGGALFKAKRVSRSAERDEGRRPSSLQAFEKA
ncbi:MAG: hypothetical protein K6E36_12830 [Oscillospiraceae bacterium]|nr:hypothetical protein [Oscillospiraceae bacterium]